MFPVMRLFHAVPAVVLVMVFTLFAALFAANAHTQTVCKVPADRATIQAAVDDAACETVNLDAGTFYESVKISRTVTIQGQGVDMTVVDGNANGSVFSIRGGVVVTLTGLTVTNGSASSGGGIAVSAGSGEKTEVHVVRCKIAGNSATYSGGGVLLSSDLQGSTAVYLIDTTVEGNSATSGGGIYSGMSGRLGSFTDARVYVTNSTLRDNVASDYGGGICNVGYSAVYVTNSTISGNSAGNGGGIHNGAGGVRVTYSTLSANSASENGGGIYNIWPPPNGPPYHGFMYFQTSCSIIANSPLGGACVNDGDASITDDGYNLSDDASCISDSTSQTNDPMLGPLQDNGGPTYTHAPAPGSPAIDGSENAACPATDQRGIPRPIDGDENGTAVCDIGSYEIFNPSDFVYLPLIGK